MASKEIEASTAIYVESFVNGGEQQPEVAGTQNSTHEDFDVAARLVFELAFELSKRISAGLPRGATAGITVKGV